jgi:hypothetical protein
MKQTFLTINNHLNGYSLAVTVALDLAWNLFDAMPLLNLLLMPVIFLFCATAVTLIQRNLSYDEWGTALLKGAALGFVAALPFSVLTSVAGAIFGVLKLQYGTDQDVILLGELTKAWGRLEKVLKSPFQPAQIYGKTLDQIIDLLYEQGSISAAEKSDLHQLRMARNKIVHNGQAEDFSIQGLSELVKRVRAFGENLGRRLKA